MCLLHLTVDGVDIDMYEERSICARTATRLVPFLVTIPNLKRVFAGGWFDRRRLFFYRDDYSYLDEQETAIFRSLVLAFLGALQGRLFPRLERIAGITEALDIHSSELCEGGTGEICSFCRDVCTHFPVKDLLENADLYGFGHCGEEDSIDIYEFIAYKRPNSRAIFKATTECNLFEALETHLRNWAITNEDIEEEKLLEKVRTHNQACTEDRKTRIDHGGGTNYMLINYMNETGLSVLDRMIALGFHPRVISKDRLRTLPVDSILIQWICLFSTKKQSLR